MAWVKGAPGRWEGGRVWEDRRGRRTYIIRRKISGRRYEVSTRCTRIWAARQQLERFEADPEGYEPGGGAGEPLRLSRDLAQAFLAWSGAPEREGGKANSRPWVLQQRAYLAWWADQLRGRDLRTLSLPHQVIPALDGTPGRRHRIEVLKVFYSWMRRERHLLTRQQDPTLDLQVQARRPEQWRRPKAIPRAHYLRVLAALAPAHRDALVLLDETGWHVSELARFVRGGTLEEPPRGARRDGAVALAVCPQHKGGQPFRSAIGVKAKTAATRLLDRGAISVGRLYEAVRAACVKAKIQPFTPGRFRHTFATRAVEAGADPAQVSAYLHQKSEATMRKFYSTLAVVPRPPR